MMLFNRVTFVLLICFSSHAAYGGDEPLSAEQWLKRMSEAVKMQSYQGRSVFHNGRQMTSIRVMHTVVDGESWDRIVHLSGEPAEIVRKGQKIACLHPESAIQLQGVARRGALVEPFKHMDFTESSIYRFYKSGEGRVAGRAAQIINVIPEDKARYGYQLAIDKKTGVLLKTVMLDRKGDALEVFEFIDITIGGHLPAELFEPGEGVKWIQNAPVNTALEDPSLKYWDVKWLPKGFYLAEQGVRDFGGERVNARVYTDGLAVFTVFLEKSTDAYYVEGRKQRGATIALSRHMNHQSQNFLVTVVGEVPVETAMQVAASVQKNNAESANHD